MSEVKVKLGCYDQHSFVAIILDLYGKQHRVNSV